MSHVIASPFGLGLPYPGLFLVSKRKSTKRRPADYFWEKATAPIHPVSGHLLGDNTHPSPSSPATSWLDEESVAVFSDSEDERIIRKPGFNLAKKKKSFAKMREIAFRAFVPKPGSTKTSTVVATEIVSHQHLSPDQALSKDCQGGFTLFNSWRLKSRGTTTKVKKLSAMVKRRINSRSPAHLQPKTWEEYHRCYAAEEIDINDPPLPPAEPNAEQPTAWEAKCYAPPLADDEAVRQLVINRLDVFGTKTGFDPSEDAAARATQRKELAEKLEASGQEPRDLSKAWDRSSTATDFGLDAARAMMRGARSGNIPPETLEQHPVFRKIVRQCREMFGTSISMLSIMQDDSQVFLAESGLFPMRAAPRELTVCSHTVLSGRKGFTILDTRNDWRFASSPLVNAYGARFYSGVPLMAPNLDGAAESDEAACPIGTLCVIDDKPREEFGIEERKKLVYMAEYARREIEEWFKSKLAVKMEVLEESHKVFVENVAQVEEVEDEPESMPTGTFNQGTGDGSLISTPPTSPSSAAGSVSKIPAPVILQAPSVFDDPIGLVKPKMQKVFDLATKLVGETLDLSLVYLIAVAPHGDSTTIGQTLILSGFNLPSPPPVFDAGLHLRVLKTPEGGLLYQNPSSHEVQEAGLDTVASSNPYASAMLVRLGPEPIGNAGGFVMAGFTTNLKRVFGGEDVIYMKQFASELNRYTHKLKL
ncbi:hypothetical protein DFH28DRAFT_944583 [Melampsora americana]|nr:hypothetical protein DFH28DRAFT_944583 [Melampsora americana]